MRLKDLKIGVVGGGVVGRATARCYLEHVQEVLVYDLVPERATHQLDEVLTCDLVFVCLPEGEVRSFFSALPINRRNLTFVLRSTVPIGTTQSLVNEFVLTNLVHSPEFLTERCAQIDVQIPARNVIGGSWCHAMLVLSNVYKERFPAVPVHVMSSNESEALKLFQNAFFATKVAFFNEVYRLCEKMRLDYQSILHALLADGRIHPSHTQVPGPDGQFGFGGKCLPKDLMTLMEEYARQKIRHSVIEGAYYRNLQDRQTS